MDRRRFLGAMGGAAVAVWAGASRAQQGQSPQQQQQQTQQFPGSPLTQPRNQTLQIPDMQPDLLPAKPDPMAILQHNQQEIQKDVTRLFGLADELRKQVSRTDSSKVLSLDLIHTAEEIEKLAKQIRNLARA
ncbi:MAG TPA: hypothetical protein VGS20_08980 [Candidatus Acidoferrales bacterium]|nr:hypothetical protein [Candidatus Acidoferrales bacterium]